MVWASCLMVLAVRRRASSNLMGWLPICPDAPKFKLTHQDRVFNIAFSPPFRSRTLDDDHFTCNSDTNWGPREPRGGAEVL
jgi:hypothetical protein